MAEGDDGEHTRFPCLAMVRYMVATVVTVLTVVVVVMVITDGLRPEEIRLSIDRGYIRADQLVSVTVEPGPYNGDYGEGDLGPYIGDYGEGDLGTEVGQTEFGRNVRPLVKTYKAADSVSLRVILSAHNPSGRASVNCSITTIRVLDMPNAPLFTEMEEIGRFNFTQQKPFSVPRQTSHTLTEFVTISNTTVLSYIFERYLAKSSFSALVEVNATVFHKPLSSGKPHNISQQHYCWPVTVGTDTQAGTDVSCKTSKEIDWTVNPAPIPAPAPAPAAGVDNS